MEQGPLWEAKISSVKRFPAFYGTRSFFTTSKIACHRSLCRSRSNQPMPSHHTSWRSILILSPVNVGLPVCLFPSGFPTKNLCVPLLSPKRTTCTAYLTLLYLITRITFLRSKDYKTPCYVIFSILPFRPKYLPQYPILEYPQSILFCQC
jgi:hypothetical protein